MAFSGVALWMDAQQYSSLSQDEKNAVAAAIEEYEKVVAAAKKKLADDIALITIGKFGSTD